MPGRKSTKREKTTEAPVEVPLEGPPMPLEVPREDIEVPREDAHVEEAERTVETDAPPPTRTAARAERDVPPPPPPTINKTQSEMHVEDSLITSFVNGAKSREIEVVFAFDTTGSMNVYLTEVRKKLKETCTKLTTDIPNIKIGIMAFGDYCDFHTYVVKHQDLCNDTNKLVNWVETVQGTGGGDAPEAYELALREAKGLSWSPLPTVNKAFVIIGDASPHAPSYTTEKIFWRNEVADLVKKGVKIYGVHCNPNNNESKPFYEEVAEMSGGICLSLKHLQLITDMFKAVCYREFGAEHLETYRAEVAEGGRMDDQMADLFTQLKQGPNAKTKLGERSTAEWYLEKFDRGTRPSYEWNESTKKWQHYSGKKVAKPATTATSPSHKRKDEPEASSSSPAKKAKTEPKEKSPKKPAKKEVKKKDAKKSPVTKKEKKVDEEKKKKKAGAKKAKKVEEEEEEEGEEEEEKKTLAKGTSIIVGTGEWKRDRFGRMASLHDA